jgi:predicted HTH domain antitoxin
VSVGKHEGSSDLLKGFAVQDVCDEQRDDLSRNKWVPGLGDHHVFEHATQLIPVKPRATRARANARLPGLTGIRSVTSWQLRDGRGIAHPDRLALRAISVSLNGMKITVELPDDLVLRPDPGREALEALAIEGYRSAALTHYEASRLLHMSRFEFDALLKTRHIEDHAYDVEDLARDLATLDRLEADRRSRP